MAAEGCVVHKWNIITAEEKRSHDRTADEHIDVLCKKVKAKFHGRIFLVVSKVQFVLRFRKIEWCTVAFSKCTNQEDQEAEWLIKEIPRAIELAVNDGIKT